MSLQRRIAKINKQFEDEINGGTIVAMEVLVSSKANLSPNCQTDAIAAVFLVVHNESAQLDLDEDYNKINILIINRRESPRISAAPLGI